MESVNVAKGKLRAVEITYVGMFSALMMIGANITSFVPFLVIGGVPITLQSFFAVLAGALLGSRLGAISMTVYALLGLIGAPVFARFSGGFSSLLSPTFGFIISFIFTAYITGKIVERSQRLPVFITAAFFGLIVNYFIGTNWMYAAFKLWADAPEGFNYKVAWIMLLPPLPKDLVLSIFAGVMAYRINKTFSILKSKKRVA
ncbi:biotin transporter BioY [Bacillus aquiflavi]|uniref:Biotin transporter n=1 Tax=Bacillus aquiflavi TaxID=2672567 RepID=A0A6B3W2W9_9BACI|nr:biotin transporter BioY [Bacillus aquiflavi]MBA4538000.1 biotin transporter BioY [Bacillus aquiflavi]NEY82256.1 biotin transporter BioY [Bacillus aquiflavi]UAC48827.1 biotin transporter BioY [Bacillus aquiflavi]